MKIREVLTHLEQLAPLAYQESYDNSGLLVGDRDSEVSNVLVSLDCTENIVEEAIQRKCNLIVSHHPIVFKGLKSITGKNYVERTVIKAIQNNIALYAMHTNLDNVVGGVNFKIAQKLGLESVRILAPKKEQLMKLTVFIPVEKSGQLLDALYTAGAGDIGNYSNCSFRATGKGTFKANEFANPSIGRVGQYEEVDENRIEVIFPIHLKNQVLAGMIKGHIYEEVSYYLSILQNDFNMVGSGAIGQLKTGISGKEMLSHIKEKLDVGVIRHTKLLENNIKTVAVCGGVGSFLLPTAIREKADIFITSDFKYHEFFDAENKILIADVGHYESEQFTKELIRDVILKKFTNFATYLADENTNPVNYFY